jgi:O-antigen/teichoic acid export membrane protein
MGIVIRHSSWNLGITGAGFLLGATNVLLLATTYLDDDYYGLWGYVLSTAFLLFPLMSFGIHNTIVKYYSSYHTARDRDNFLTQMLLWPLVTLIIIVGIVLIYQDDFRLFISTRNQMVGDYLWPIIAISIFQAYFEIWYAWTKVHLKTIAGNFLKEVFYRAAATVVLILVAMDMITQVQFIYSLVIIYFLRMLLMAIIALRTYFPRFRLFKIIAVKELLWYSFLMIIAGSVSTALLDLDKNMLNQFIDIENISYYNVAVFIATVVAIPARGMAQIVHPMTASYFNKNQMGQVENLYKRSSLNLSIVSGFLLILIICNVNEFYFLLPPEFAIAIPVVLLICVVKFSENLLGSNNAILYNTNLYQFTVWLGLGLAILAFILNIWLIPILGLLGAAVATCVAYIFYAFAKAYYVYHRLHIHPWTQGTNAVLLLITTMVLAFYFWDFQWNIYLNIVLKSLIIAVVYVTIVYRYKMSQELSNMLQQFITIKKRRS